MDGDVSMTSFRMQHARRLVRVFATLVVLNMVAASAVFASAITGVAATYANSPPLGIAGAAPLVMLNLSRDHQLFYKAYNDFSDLDGDGVLDTTYRNSLVYAGYFDSAKCYDYSSSGYFTPKGALDSTGYCSSSWSGNFLNWVSMTRMDEVRKILYGGLRSQDDTTTLLERAYLPPDAHSFAKFYNGSDIAKLTPYKVSTTAPSSSVQAPSTFYYNNQASYGDNGSTYMLIRLQGVPNSLGVQAGDQILITANNSATNPATLTAPVRFLNTGSYSSSAGGNYVELRVQDGMFSSNMNCSDNTSCLTQFLKYNGWVITNLTRTGISFCNTTVQGGDTNRSQTNKAPPLIRMQTGNYALWASNESLQCQWFDEKSNSQSGFTDGFLSNGNRTAFSGIGASAENPNKKNGTQGTDWDEFIARVQVCVSGNIGSETCKQYPDDTAASNPYKPIGLLQKYAEIGSIKFGLVTPTFDHNASGGVVRSALPGPGTNSGDFISSEIDAATGRMVSGATGIIANINALRIYGYAYGSGDNYGTGNGCTYQRTGITTGSGGGTLVSEGNCSSWGNPMAESYIETLRYLAGKTPTSNFQQKNNGEDATLGLTVVATWNDPVNAANFCAPLNIINFNASSLSYDTDAVSGFSDLSTGKTVQDWTDLVGVGEGINGKTWFVGNPSSGYAGGDADLCSAKTISSFSAALGICPEVPALKGGYLMAGAAYGAHVNRIRDLGNDSTGQPVVPVDDRTSLKVNTFGVQLATNTPQIRVGVPGSATKFITIIPAYRLTLTGGVGGGALVDFKVLSQTTDGTTARGSFYAVWEDSFAGGDYDQDMWGIINYEITATTVKITTRPVAASTNNGQGFGYIINGTTKDGVHFHSGIYSFSYTDPTNPDIYNAAGTRINGTGAINTSGGCSACVVNNAATTAVYAIGSSNAGTLSDPLLYASKWGGFRADTTKPDGTDTPVNDANPTDKGKWSTNAAGTPDNYFLVTDPGKLSASLDTLFRKILAKISSGTAASTVAASANGTGVTYQAIYEAERTDTSGDRATWVGSLSSLWTDSAGLLREDGNHNNQLDDYNTDPVVTFAYQPGSQRTIATRFASSDPAKFVPTTSVSVELSDLDYLWNARTLLWDPALVNTQRPYGTAFSNAAGRYIFTWVDANNDGIPTATAVRPFVWNGSGTDGINPTNYRYLNSNSTTEAQNIVDWIRGKENATLRNRTVDFGTTANLIGRVTRLGDIVNSTPLAVAAPAEAYDLLYNDSTYAKYRTAYRDRRQMVYVGANDGMIHAFNSGFYNTSCKRFTLQPNDAVCTAATPKATGSATSTPTAHPLGAEVWAYVPKNVLPHLRWLTDPAYSHMFYADGAPIAFDAKVFTADTTHIEGWGTILVVPFRLGGGPITVNTATSGAAANVTSDSAYVIMDVTDPEVQPTVLGEITFPGTYALSAPAAIMVRDASSGTPNKFFLAFGSGPTDPRAVSSTKNLTVSVYDMADFINPKSAPAATKVFDLGSAAEGKKSFAGDLIASDFNLDGKSEALYFGSVLNAGTTAAPTFGGHFWRVLINANPDPSKWTAGLMLNLKVDTTAPNGMPVTVRPTLARNARGAPMVYFGTGRLYNSTDQSTTSLQRIYGLIDTVLLPTTDPQYLAAISMSNLANVSNVNVSTGTAQTVTGAPSNTAFTDVTDNVSLLAAFNKAGVAGWYRNLTTNGTTNPSERVVSAQALLGNLLLTAAYTPGTSICTGLGTSVLYGQNYATGSGDPTGFFGKDDSGNALISTPIGAGLPSSPSLHTGDSTTGPAGSKTVRACTQTSTGAIVCKDVATLSPVTSGESSWREPLGN